MATTQQQTTGGAAGERVKGRGRGYGTLSKWGVALTIVLVILSNSKVTHCVEDADANALDTNENALPTVRQYPGYGGGFGGGGVGGGGGGGCPLCDSSVYSYCAQKVFHDSCCCDFPAAYSKPPQCYYNDCSLLYAKSCYEHSLIKNCCCNNPY